MIVESVQLGRSPVFVPPLGIGTWQWGDRAVWGFGRGYSAADLQAAFSAAIQAGLAFFDTAEVYGLGQSERFLGQFIQASGAIPAVATKYFPMPTRWRQQSLPAALRGSLARLQLPQADLYQVHWPSPHLGPATVAAGLARAVDAGLTRAVGVSNFSAAQLRRMHGLLAQRGVALAANQVEYSLLLRAPERNGVLAACRELGITLIAYSPLAMGMLTGKYGPDRPPPGVRGRRYRRDLLVRIEPLLQLLREVGAARGGLTPGQVALNWLICKGALPIPGAKHPRHVHEAAGALGWRLSPAEEAALDAASAAL